MPRPKLLNGLPHDLVHSFFSTLRYWEKGYMSDWIVNAAKEIGTDRIEIDILNKTILPKEIEIVPLMYHLKELDGIIIRALNHAGLENDYLKKVCFEIEISMDRWIKCKTIIIGENDRRYTSKEYLEKSYEEFKAVNLNTTDKLTNWIIKRYYRFRIKLLGRYAFRKLRYTKRLENMMK